jgi:hypothetical protein
MVSEKLIKISADISESQKKYLKMNGIQISKFLRQSIEAHKKKKFEYDYME